MENFELCIASFGSLTEIQDSKDSWSFKINAQDMNDALKQSMEKLLTLPSVGKVKYKMELSGPYNDYSVKK